MMYLFFQFFSFAKLNRAFITPDNCASLRSEVLGSAKIRHDSRSSIYLSPSSR